MPRLLHPLMCGPACYVLNAKSGGIIRKSAFSRRTRPEAACYKPKKLLFFQDQSWCGCRLPVDEYDQNGKPGLGEPICLSGGTAAASDGIEAKPRSLAALELSGAFAVEETTGRHSGAQNVFCGFPFHNKTASSRAASS
jgi:hypothetical protein